MVPKMQYHKGMTTKPSVPRKPPISIRLSAVYEYGLNQIAEREGVPLGKLLRRVIEKWAQAYSRAEAGDVGEYIRTSKEGADLTSFADTALEDMLTFERPAAVQKRVNE
jgi:hypothetical protein